MRKGITEQLNDILSESLKDIENNSDKIFKVAAQESVSILHSVSPKQPGGGSYAAGWTYEPTEGVLKGYIVYNATDYQLTHLLENGHALWNGTKRVRARKHIGKVEKGAIAAVMAKIQHVAE